MKGNTCKFTAHSECEGCGRVRRLTQCWMSGCETWQCDECRGETDDDPYGENDGN